MTARNDSDSKTPLPRDSICGCRISGMAPYLAGTKKALCVPIRNTVDSTRYGPAMTPCVPSQKPSRAISVMPTSATFQNTSEFHLL
jgi:hypothetical protein